LEDLQNHIISFASEFPEARATANEYKAKAETWKTRNKAMSEKLPTAFTTLIDTLNTDFESGLAQLERNVNDLVNNPPSQYDERMKAIDTQESRLTEWEQTVAVLERFVHDCDTALVSSKQKKKLAKEDFTNYAKRALALRNRLKQLRQQYEHKKSTEDKLRHKMQTFEEFLVRMEVDVDHELKAIAERGPATDLNQKKHRVATLAQLRTSVESHEPLVEEYEDSASKLPPDTDIPLHSLCERYRVLLGRVRESHVQAHEDAEKSHKEQQVLEKFDNALTQLEHDFNTTAARATSKEVVQQLQV
jgi:hypothetical protein